MISNRSPTLNPESTVVSFQNGMRLLMPSDDFMMIKSLVNMSTSLRSWSGGATVAS